MERLEGLRAAVNALAPTYFQVKI
jgi:enoyl-CoA hydratase/carnithine racemase